MLVKPGKKSDKDIKKLEEYISQSILAGKTKLELRKELLRAGWKENIIDELIGYSTMLEMKNVSKSFNQKPILQKINLEIKRREIFGIIGESGAGKTTLLNLIIGFVEPDYKRGEILVKKFSSEKQESGLIPLKNNLEEARKRIGFSSQTPSFYPELTVEENIHYFARLHGLKEKEIKQNINEILDMIELKKEKKQPANDLSGGMKKRLDIGCALIHNPDILILDEPTADLDPLLRKETWDLIRKINSLGTTIFMASHFLGEIETICDRIAILHEHQLQKIGTVEELRYAYAREDRIILKTYPGDYEKLTTNLKKDKLLKITKITYEPHHLIIQIANPEKALPHILKELKKLDEKLIEISLRKPRLKEIFEELVEAKK